MKNELFGETDLKTSLSITKVAAATYMNKKRKKGILLYNIFSQSHSHTNGVKKLDLWGVRPPHGIV